MRKRLFSAFLCLCMMVSFLPSMAFAGDTDGTSYVGGLCEHHVQHDDACGYSEGTAEVPCNHVHTEECYQLVTNCVHEHTEECDREGSEEPDVCSHQCSEETGCIGKELDCKHEHDEVCGYVPTTEGTPCTYVCEICNPPVTEEPKCICQTKCTEGKNNADCPVCGEEGDISACIGAEKAEEPQCICETKCTEEEGNKNCPVCGVSGKIDGCVGAAMMLTFKGARAITPTSPEGVGTKDNPYQIKTKEELYWFAELVNGTLTDDNGNPIPADTDACAVLTKNITINENVLNTDGSLNSGTFEPWTPMGNETDPYTGTFDGNGHTISGLYLDIVESSEKYLYAGLFGYSTGTIQNVNIDDTYISVVVQNKEYYDCLYVGGICGYSNGAIVNCDNDGTVTAEATGEVNVGGICGKSDGTITDCTNLGDINGKSVEECIYGGGICGYNDNNGTITGCTNKEKVTVNGNRSSEGGGICGESYGGTIRDCINRGNVSVESTNADVDAGDICGSNRGFIENCSSQGDIMAIGDNWTYAGGVCGSNYDGNVITCSSQGNITCIVKGDDASRAGGICGINRGNITDCSSQGNVRAGSKGTITAGGICGYNNEEGNVTNCTSQGNVTAQGEEDSNVGGISGSNAGKITNCSSQGNIKAVGITEAYAGGVCGENYGEKEITNCSSQGDIMAESNEKPMPVAFVAITPHRGMIRQSSPSSQAASAMGISQRQALVSAIAAVLVDITTKMGSSRTAIL